MTKHLLLITFLLLSLLRPQQLFAQKFNGTVHAELIDQKKQPVEYATVSVVNAADSIVVKSGITGKRGDIEFTGLPIGKYRLVASQLGLKTLSHPFELTADHKAFNTGTLMMEPEVRSLKQVDVTAQKAPVTVKKDTVEFNAASFKTQPNDNVEQLLKKLPGVDVDKDGKITAQGQQVTKVLVDGKEFFGNDPKAATKNLPADAIAKVQVIDDKTERAKNTGIDDGQREKVMNLTLKEDKKSGWFGNASAAGGNSDRYLGQFNLNHFDRKKQFSALFLSNNVNESGFTMEDLQNFTGGDIFSAFGSSTGGISINVSANGRANINGAFSGVNGGLITNHTGGLNYSDSWGKKDQFKFNANMVSILSSNNLVETDNIQDPALSQFVNQSKTGTNKYNSYRLNMNMEYKMDSLTTFRLKPSLSTSYQNNNNISGYATTGTDNALRNQGSQALLQTLHKPNVGGQFTVNRKFANGKGSINFFTQDNFAVYRNKYTNQSRLRLYPTNGTPTDSLSNLQTGQDNNGVTSNSTLSWITRLSKRRKLNMTFSQNFRYQNDNANQSTLDYNNVTGKYEILAPNYSGEFDNTNWRYSSSVGLNKTADKYTANLNAELADVGLKGTFNGVNQSSVSRDSWAFVPNASFSYRPKNGLNVYLSARSDVNMPSINDLQPVLNTSNTTYKRIGNPDLTMSRNVDFSININSFDFKSNSYFGLYGGYTRTWNGFSTESYVDNAGITTSRPINTDGNFNSYLGLNIGKPTKIKGLRFNLGFNGSINKNVNYINRNKNEVTRITPSVNAGGSYDLDKFSIGLRGYISYNNAKNSFQHVADQQYYSYNNNFNVSVRPFKNWRLYGDLTQSLYRGKPASSNQSIYLLNAGLERYFLKSQNLTLALTGFDILNQNAGLQRNISNTGQITNSLTNTIGQYFYMKLTYKISKVGAPKNGAGNGIVIVR
ncbi:TonB-dependent receptor family protein [Mucilaginibacter sp. RS28]|uniref:TonB-dependent receptor family protein n=1 Tax=Mucilaginibacter straminoryzae TaxID=2932774 RepID=A0A9X2BBG5_9SPHI|nr:outer membrane beta-barrel protein [Mucilaginibacter straminoryzae]MCJ8208218.1 TonB-dependent receptor family protein [Mucilaginibacter straminoryzae]